MASRLDQKPRFMVFGRDQSGADAPVAGIRLAFRLAERPAGAENGELIPSEAVTDAAGTAEVDFLVGDRPGIYRIEAYAPDYRTIPPISVTVLGGVQITGAPQDGRVGQTAASPLAVRLEKAPGVYVGEDEGEVRFNLLMAPPGTRLSGKLAYSDASGLAVSDLRFGDSQGRIDVGISILKGLPGNTSFLEPIVVSLFALDAWSSATSLLGGVALFLFGMRMMSESLQFVAGEKLRYLLSLLTTNRFMAVGAGAMVTALIQSSSACTVMVVGFVNAGLMRLEQAIGVIMGANIGTTLTAQIISLNLARMALPAITIGVVILFLAKRQAVKSWASVIIGFGMLFLGMTVMSDELLQLRDSLLVTSLFRGLNCRPEPGGFIPIWQFMKAVGCGLAVTLVLQSSAATIGMLITVAAAGLIDPYAAFGILLGDNIGTTITAALASIGTGAAAKRAACFHVMFNVFGVAIMILLNYVEWPGRPGRPIFMELANLLTPGDVFVGNENLPRFLANAHTLFNATCTAVFVLFVPQFARLCRFLIHSAPAEDEYEGDARRILEPHLLSTPYLAIRQVWAEVGVMLGKARESQREGYAALLHAPTPDWDENLVRAAKNLEEETDELKTAITKYLGGISLTTLNENQAEMFPRLVHAVNDAEKVADIGKHISKLARRANRQSIALTPEAVNDMNQLRSTADEILKLAEKTITINADGIETSGGGAVLRKKLLDDGKRLEKDFKSKSSLVRKNHEKRNEQGLCEIRAGIIFMDVVNSLGRSAGCGINIIEAACPGEAAAQASANRRISIRLRDET
ncbi:MAG: Na/Pi cotransporter family protein [Planctomycetota bacterium]|nr:Na/Pi cotransporter family protein [Planctomycetota bacterium]MDR1520121.1 Na/Pi cotransporter family protein [Planctomycetota bacterium]